MNRYGIVANIINDRVLRTNSKVYILTVNGDCENPRVFGMSKGGRMVEKYIKFKRLENFRAAWIPEHIAKINFMMMDKLSATDYAKRLNSVWSGVRFFNRDGTEIIKDGISTGEAFKIER